jgi:hypothetical protein
MFSCDNIRYCLRYFFTIINILIEHILSDDFWNNHINFYLFKFLVANDSETKCEFNSMKNQSSFEDYCMSTIFSSLERRHCVTFRVFLRDLIIRRSQEVSQWWDTHDLISEHFEKMRDVNRNELRKKTNVKILRRLS